jgi:hypothetical protein
MTGIVAKGTARISGSGVVHAGVPSGTVKVVISDGQLASATGGWTLDGAAFTGEFFYEGNGFRVKSVTPFDLTVGTISTGRFGARAFSAQGVLNEDGRVALSGARVEIAGGRVTLDPTTMSLAPLAVEATLNVIDVGMQDIAALVPAGLSAAQGRIDGIVRVGWSTARGFHVGAGNLTLGESEPATVRLAPTPGFLTRTMPKRFEPVPAWTGPLSRWLSADNPIYRDMAEIELGRTPLRVESLSVRLTPEGDALGRTATVRMVARPLQPDAAVKVVNIDVNVAGPLDSILHLGLNQKFSIETHR